MAPRALEQQQGAGGRGKQQQQRAQFF